MRRQVCRRVERRRRELELPDLPAYRAYLESHPEEWTILDGLCGITISRFWRDRGVWELLRDVVLPALGSVEAWSAGCASGEEPYSLVLAAADAGVRLRVVATDADPVVLARAREACYEGGSLRDLPEGWRERAFVRRGGRYCLREELRRGVTILRHDVRTEPPGGPFDLVLCRNLAFTYFEPELQREVCARIAGCLRPGGALVVGAHEALPDGAGGFEPWSERLGVYRRAPDCR